MDILNHFKSHTDKRADDVRAGLVAPSREERRKCWAARDEYYACLDANAIDDPLKEEKVAAKACRRQGADFERDCAAQWVVYFKKWRVQDIKKRNQIRELEAQGANKLSVETNFVARP